MVVVRCGPCARMTAALQAEAEGDHRQYEDHEAAEADGDRAPPLVVRTGIVDPQAHRASLALDRLGPHDLLEVVELGHRAGIVFELVDGREVPSQLVVATDRRVTQGAPWV